MGIFSNMRTEKSPERSGTGANSVTGPGDTAGSYTINNGEPVPVTLDQVITFMNTLDPAVRASALARIEPAQQANVGGADTPLRSGIETMVGIGGDINLIDQRSDKIDRKMIATERTVWGSYSRGISSGSGARMASAWSFSTSTGNGTEKLLVPELKEAHTPRRDTTEANGLTNTHIPLGSEPVWQDCVQECGRMHE